MKSRKENFKTRFLAGIMALAMIFTMFGVMPEEVKASSGVTLNEGEIYKFADCDWMAVEVHDEYTTLVMIKGNTDHGDMSGAWPGYIKNGNSAYGQSIEYEDISSYYPGLTYLYSQINDKEYAAATGEGLYLVPYSFVSEITGKYWEALMLAARYKSSFGADNYCAWVGTVRSLGTAWYVDEDYGVDTYNQFKSCVVAPTFNLDTSKISEMEIVSTFVTATFNDYDGTQISQKRSYYDYPVSKPVNPTRTGYTFAGWSENGSDVISVPFKITENKTYTAVYTANTYTIKYDANGGTGSMTDTPATYDQDVSLRNNTFTKANNTFKGWATSASGSVAYNNGATVSNLSTMNGDEVTLYAIWELDSKTITFNDYNGTQISQDSVAYDSDLTAPADPERTGYTFAGWSENGSDAISLPAKVTANKTYTAVYTANTYTIKYDANGGTGSMADTAATYDQDVSLRNNTFTKANNTFKGWATSASGSVAYNNGSTVRNLSAASGSAVTLYAVWETQQSSGGNSGGSSSGSSGSGGSSGGSSSGSSSGSGGSSGGGGGFYVPVQPSKPEEKPEEKPAKPTEPTTDTATETIDGCTVNTTISKDAAGNITSATAEISVPASGKISANNMSITLSSAVIAKLKEQAGSADMNITIDVCVPEASTKSLATEQKSTVVTTINTTLANLCKGSRPVRIVSGKNVLAPATLTAKADGSIVLSKLTPKYNYKVLSSKDYSSARTAIYKTAKLAKTSATIKKGKTTTIKLSTKFDKKNLKKITYSTSNKKIATVSKSGKVTGKKKGTATIKAKLYMQDGKTKALTFKVKVK